MHIEGSNKSFNLQQKKNELTQLKMKAFSHQSCWVLLKQTLV